MTPEQQVRVWRCIEERIRKEMEMTIQIDDKFRALCMAAVTSAFPVLQILGVVSLTGDEIAVITAFVGNGLLVLAYMFKTGQEPAKLPLVQVSIPDDRELVYKHPDPKGGTCVSWVPEIWDGSPTRCHCGALELVGE